MIGHDAIKLELIEWLTKLEDNETIEFLKVVKDARSSKRDWWQELTDEQQAGITELGRFENSSIQQAGEITRI